MPETAFQLSEPGCLPPPSGQTVQFMDYVALEPLPCFACGRFCACDGLFAQQLGKERAA